MIDIDQSRFEHVVHQTADFGFAHFVLKYSTISHWHNHIEFVWVRRGELIVTINDTTFTAQEGDIVFVPSGSIHSYTVSNGCIHNVFLLEKSVLDRGEGEGGITALFFNSALRFICVHSGESPDLIELFSRISREYEQKDTDFRIAIRAMAELFLLGIYRSYPLELSQPSKNFDKYKEAVLYVAVNYKKRITTDDAAKLLHFSPQHFCRIFKKYSAMTFSEYLNAFRLRKARELLRSDKRSIDEIARSVGFCDGGYLIRLYKKHYGITPAKDRSNNHITD